ncbi:MAG: phosphate signaling complex protein PhoU [Nevskiales bacterium]
MDKPAITQHISRQFNAELEDVRQRVLAMGGLVEQQIADAVTALIENKGDLGEAVAAGDKRVNSFEIAIDEECSRILARRQPTASDLRLVVAISKTITDLERIGDEAERIGRMAMHLATEDAPKGAHAAVEHLGKHVLEMVTDALDGFARMDTEAALAVAKEDQKVDREYESIIRQYITFMMEDPRTISRVLSLIWSVRALERIGDHARNIAEHVIFFVEGKDVRHISLEDMEKKVRGKK